MSKKILVIDDDPGIGEVIAEMLEFDRIEVMISLTPEDGLVKARYKNPLVILLDLNLPNIDGFEVYKTLKKDKSTSEIPIVLITGQTDTETLKIINEQGLTGVFYKPFQFSHLRRKINSLIDGKTTGIIQCRKCGKKLEEDWDYCPYDGTKRR
ncbi:response regulator [candidate division KSB1 bacterium]